MARTGRRRRSWGPDVSAVFSLTWTEGIGPFGSVWGQFRALYRTFCRHCKILVACWVQIWFTSLRAPQLADATLDHLGELMRAQHFTSIARRRGGADRGQGNGGVRPRRGRDAGICRPMKYRKEPLNQPMGGTPTSWITGSSWLWVFHSAAQTHINWQVNNVTIRALHVLAFSKYPVRIGPSQHLRGDGENNEHKAGRTRRWPVFHVMVWYMHQQGSLSLTMLLIARSDSSGRAKAPHLTHFANQQGRLVAAPWPFQDNQPQRSSEKKEASKEIAWRKKSTEEVRGSSAYVHGIPFTFKEFQRIYDWAAASSRQVQNSRNNNDVFHSQHELKCSQTNYMICLGVWGRTYIYKLQGWGGWRSWNCYWVSAAISRIDLPHTAPLLEWHGG